jgi:hypothetical protein
LWLREVNTVSWLLNDTFYTHKKNRENNKKHYTMYKHIKMHHTMHKTRK